MSHAKVLVDTNAYLRLAKTIRPLLFSPFGDKEYCLYILPELNAELRNRNLKSRFHWVDEPEYAQNREHFPSISRAQKRSIQQTFDYLWDYVKSDLPGPSRTDTLYIAYALELGIPLVTDDQDMTALAREFDAEVMPTLRLLKVMFDCGHVDMKTIEGLCDYWKYIADLPANFHADYQRLFGV